MITYSKDYDTLINAQCVIIANNQNYLNSTDYRVIREAEGGEAQPEADKTARANARAAIEAARAAIAVLEEEKRKEEEEQPQPEPEQTGD